jgi:hypothetical protein
MLKKKVTKALIYALRVEGGMCDMNEGEENREKKTG